MGLHLNNIVPWGRSLDEYRSMFSLTPEDVQKRILDCGGGPASFNAEMAQQGHRVICADPIYQFSADQIQQRVLETWPVILEGVRAHQQDYLWEAIADPEALVALRLAAMEQFIQDLPTGLTEGRYITAELPQLPFADDAFDLALCGHLLFTYSQQLSLDLHRQSVQELCRVAREVRIFPVLTLDGQPSPWLQPILTDRLQCGYEANLVPVNYEFQRGGNQMLRITRAV